MTRFVPLLSSSFVLAVALACGCGDDAPPDCEGIVCGACESAINLVVTVAGAPDGTTVTAVGLPITCEPVESGESTCFGDVAPGTYTGTLQAGASSAPVEITVLVDTSTGCCSCGYVPYHGTATIPYGASDAGMPPDSSVATDAGAGDGGPAMCRAERVDFPMGGSLAPGTLCDDVFACAADADDAARIMAAAAHFVCEEGPGGTGRCDAWTCNYRNPGGPSILDEAEVQEICSLTALEPTPELVCVVYL